MPSEQGKLGRPKVLIRRYVIEVKKETRDWIEEMIGVVTTRAVAGKGLRAVGEAAKGLLSHPAGLLVIAAGSITLAALTPWGRAKLGIETDDEGLVTSINRNIFMAYATSIYTPITGAAGFSPEETRKAIGLLWDVWQEKIGKPVIGFLQGLF